MAGNGLAPLEIVDLRRRVRAIPSSSSSGHISFGPQYWVIGVDLPSLLSIGTGNFTSTHILPHSFYTSTSTTAFVRDPQELQAVISGQPFYILPLSPQSP